MAFGLHEAIPQQPVIAILTMDDELRPFRGNQFNFIDLIRTGKELGALVYVVRVKDLKLGQRRIVGFLYHAETKTWTKALLPAPQVVYNRIPTRKDEQLPEVQQTIQACLKSSQLRLFNPSFFSKWGLFEWLGKAKTTRRMIPATKRFGHPQELESFLQQHAIIYLKPIRGKAGKGIMRVERLKGKQRPYKLSVQVQKKSRVTHFANLLQLWAALKEQIGAEEYIMQQGIVLAKHGDRPFDLRVLVQKNQKGEWGLSGVGARVAGRQSITTHVPRGGSIDNPEKLLTSVFGAEQAKRMMLKVKQSALAIARQIEKASGHVLGEMSMDLGIDASGQIWFFEANSRPMKFDEPEIRKKSLERIIQYSLYLAKSRKKSR